MEPKKPRNNRFNSFDLSLSEFRESNLKNIIFELQTFFPSKPSEFSEIDRLIEDYKDANCLENGGENNEEEDLDLTILSPSRDKFVKTCVQDSQRCIEILKSIRSLMNEVKSDVENVTNWDTLVKSGFKVLNYHTFCYSLMRLLGITQDKTCRDLAFNVGRTYISTLGLPGAKRCLIFDAELVITFFKLFSFNNTNQSTNDYDDKFFEIQLLQILDECNVVFNIVCLSDQEEVLDKYIETLSKTLEKFLTNSRHSSYDIIYKCYNNLEQFCLKPLPDKEIEKIMFRIFCQTVDLHFIAQKRNSKFMINNSRHGEAISDFFLHLLNNYFDKTKNVLLKFIKSLLSNLDHKFDREKYQKLFDVAAKYELAIYWKCNESIFKYLEKLSLASDHRQRLNCVEFCGKMLLINSTPDINQQPKSSIELPRETLIIKLLFEKIYDKQDNVKLKALNALKVAMINGNEYCKKIFSVLFKQNSSPDDRNNPEIVQALREEAGKFQINLLSLLQTSSATYIKKSCLEILAQNCDNLLDNEIFFQTMESLTEDSSYLVKNNLLENVNFLLMKHPKNKNVLELFLHVVLDLTRDNDIKLVDCSVKILTGIFQKIESFENTVQTEQLLPWNIIRSIMVKNKRGLLQTAMSSSSVATNFLSQDKLRKIETHIFTSNKSEAWCILSIIAKRMKSENPEIVVKIFLDQIEHIEDDSYGNNDFPLILEVIQNWVQIFSVNSKTQIALKISDLFEKGNCPISLCHHLWEVLTLTRTILFGIEETVKYSKKLNEISRKFILENFNETSGEKVLSFLLIYCETNTDLPKRPDKKLLEVLFEYLRKVVNDNIKVNSENDATRKLNCSIIVLSRFSLRDNELASDLTPLLAMILKKKNMHMSSTKTVLQVINDLCKKHTATVTPIFKEIVYKLHSQNEEIRLCALANIYDLVMQDFLKLKGRLLLNLLACLVDKNELIQLKSQAAILSYATDKNQNLLYTCFLEAVFLFNDFISNDNFGVFPLDEIDRNNLLLHGDEKREQRFELYNFFVQNIHDINESHLLMLLNQIIVLKEKLEKKKFKKCLNGIETFKDLLHIFKLICDKRGESKTLVSKAENADYANEEECEEPSTARQKPNKKKQTAVTLNDAIPVVEKMIVIYPKFVTSVIQYDESLENSTSELTKSIVQNFSSFIEYSKNSFWHEAIEKSATSSKRKKRTKGFCGDSSDSE